MSVHQISTDPHFESIGQVAARVVANAADPYGYWREALKVGAGRALTRDQARAFAITTEPRAGFYRRRVKGGTDVPVAIWIDQNGMVALAGDRPVIPDDVWTWCCAWPISEEVYRTVADDGQPWPDDEPTVTAMRVPSAGHNSGAVDDAELLRDQIRAAKAGAAAYARISDDETLAKAQSLRARLNELAGEADKKREALKRPHLEAGKTIDKEWQPIVKDAKGAADAIRAAMSAYETEKLCRAREAERLAEAEKPERAPAPAPAPVRGTYGRAASVRVRQVVTAVTDWPALSGYMLDHPEVRGLLTKLAQRAVDAGRTVPGITVEEEARVA